MPELTGYFCCNGIIPRLFRKNGGLGKLAAEWMVEGEPSLDMFGWDVAAVRRMGGQGPLPGARVADQYAHRFKIHFPGEEREAGRPARTRPAYAMQTTMGAKFGLNYGWEPSSFL